VIVAVCVLVVNGKSRAKSEAIASPSFFLCPSAVCSLPPFALELLTRHLYSSGFQEIADLQRGDASYRELSEYQNPNGQSVSFRGDRHWIHAAGSCDFLSREAIAIHAMGEIKINKSAQLTEHCRFLQPLFPS